MIEVGTEGLDCRWTDGVLWLTLARPRARNAMTIAMRRGLIEAVRAADADPETRLVVLTGADPAFSAGLDLKEALGDGTGSPRGARTDPAEVVRASRTPVLGVINGLCCTGALELALSCAFLIASDRARFADTHARRPGAPVAGVAIRRFSTTVREGNTPRPSGRWTSPARRIAWGVRPVRSRPSSTTLPATGGTSPDRARAGVLLPAPFGPSTASVLFGATSKVTSRSAWAAP